MKKVLVGLSLIMLCGCVPSGNTKPDASLTSGKSLLATKQSIVNIHESFRTPCKTGLVAATDCKKVDSIIMQAEPLYDTLVDALILNVQTGIVSEDSKTKQQAFEALAGDLIALSVKYSIKPEGAK